MNRTFIRRHITALSILIFIASFALVQCFRPSFLYDEDGSLRKFGLGYKKKTIIPGWLVAIILAVLSYLFVLYYLAMPKLVY